jgi:hypothetical protein
MDIGLYRVRERREWEKRKKEKDRIEERTSFGDILEKEED